MVDHGGSWIMGARDHGSVGARDQARCSCPHLTHPTPHTPHSDERPLTYTCTDICVQLCAHICARSHIPALTYTCAHIYVHSHICALAYEPAHTYVHSHVRPLTHTHTHTHSHTYTHTHICPLTYKRTHIYEPLNTQASALGPPTHSSHAIWPGGPAPHATHEQTYMLQWTAGALHRPHPHPTAPHT